MMPVLGLLLSLELSSHADWVSPLLLKSPLKLAGNSEATEEGCWRLVRAAGSSPDEACCRRLAAPVVERRGSGREIWVAHSLPFIPRWFFVLSMSMPGCNGTIRDHGPPTWRLWRHAQRQPPISDLLGTTTEFRGRRSMVNTSGEAQCW
ncbi:unnamed protein product [Cuscuta campestris]|uniref:Secreted protein n=1 Tax=Cuscuta campestris TaxID=132261 RepID=A0A484M344_9ASTE|nr:unnamed protein product [Cuscuta campestris]